MNVPSYSALIYRDTLIKTVQELCENSNSAASSIASYDSMFKVAGTSLYIVGVGGFDGTNEDDPNVKSLQEVLEG